MEKKIKIGLIGLGQRGLATLRRYGKIEGAVVTALSDLSNDALEAGRKILSEQGYGHVTTFQGESQWRRLCENGDVDLVYICTDWASHARMAIYAMRQGKHVAIEVPAAMTVQECWQLVDAAEQTQRHCIMLENCCYDTFHLGIMGMLRQGMFGTVTHCEGAYIHNLSENAGWRAKSIQEHLGNPYPTHGLGPICQILNINKGDRLTSLVSMTGLNNINNTLIKTALGRTILIQFDERTPRPYSRLQTLCGTKGYAQKYPSPTLQIGDEIFLHGEDASEYVNQYQEEEMKSIISDGTRLGVDNVMNYTMDRRLIDALRFNRPLDMTVYDAALWSCITELSAISATRGNQPVEIPDFTRGHWQ